MQYITVGVLAHVDAGKTTLSEALLYKAGIIKNYGRVDTRDTLLDYDEFERKRGITIFSKQAAFDTTNYHVNWLDTPGHIDFCAEMERTLQVLDYAILIVSAADGVSGHTKTLWRMLKQYNIPTIIFVNKMDQPDTDSSKILEELKELLSENCVNFNSIDYEEIAMFSQNENILENYLETGSITDETIKELICNRLIFPCYFGSALKLQGIDEFFEMFDRFLQAKQYSTSFGAKVYKITRDEHDKRLTHIKITGGSLKIRDSITENEKINGIRLYQGDQYEAIQEATAGMICAVTGMEHTYMGQGIGMEHDLDMQLIEPVITYRMILPMGVNSREVYPGLLAFSEEQPDLKISWEEATEDIHVKLMGEVQTEIIAALIEKRFGYKPSFDMGTITYMETIESTVIGVGHFEPLRHYAEVHLLMEPGPLGSGITIDSNVSVDVLDLNWQRLIMTHVLEKSHTGVLTGSKLTDVKITVINGKAHQKHTEGGDFRQATYRAIRQGLMQAQSVLLEPYYNFYLEIPSDMVGKAMTDIQGLYGTMNPPDIREDKAIITGYGPVSTLREYHKSIRAYTKGMGEFYVTLRGYDRCHNQDEIVTASRYNPDSDLVHPSSSVFCYQGAGQIIPWYEVFDHMHVFDEDKKDITPINYKPENRSFDGVIDLEEIDAILRKTYNANQKEEKHVFVKRKPSTYANVKSKPTKRPEKKLLIVDGYNIIFAWDELKKLSEVNIDSAKDKLISILSNYQAILGYECYLIFDGYKVKGGKGSEVTTEGVTIIHTKENETADMYIERYTRDKKQEYDITVATNDNLIQQLVWGADGHVLSSRDFYQQIENAVQELRDSYNIDLI